MGSHLHLAPSPAPAQGHEGAGSAPVRVVLAATHALVRHSLALMLGTEAGFEVVGQAAQPAAMLLQVQGRHPHVLVADLSMLGDPSLHTLRQLRDRVPDLKVVVLSMNDDPALAERALQAGAAGYVLKHHADSELTDAVRHAAWGDEFVSQRVVGGPSTPRRSGERDRLTARELDVLRLLALGHTSAETATHLGMSVRMVETHRARLHRKLELRTRAELVDYALGLGLLRG